MPTYLCPKDAELLDQVIEARARGESNPLEASASPRAWKLGDVLGLLDQCPVEEPSDLLTARTLAAVDEAKQRRSFEQQIASLTGGSSSRGLHIDWRDLVAAAAIILFAVSLALPAFNHNQAQARQVACMSGLGNIGGAMGLYSADHRNTMPRGRIMPGSSWLKVGIQRSDPDQPLQSNSANLYILVRRGYVAEAKALACPDNRYAPSKMADGAIDWARPQEVSYSYQNQFTTFKQQLNRKVRIAVLADKNPLFVVRGGNKLSYDPSAPATSSSRQHARSGQNVLLTDGTVQWTTEPIVRFDPLAGGDNFWTTFAQTTYTGTEAPTDPHDSHLVP